ncbi:hypothetical protein CDD82_3108 [Ophiocordyceps australis]|uniref:Transcription elongation factor Eaf N-terminal domain-containing protein n=1 Tax=Ophiocordyceps australis TaxID=1399860 RepID=A0A2C5ZEJ8_9HYPO|nr:hypothetical protein CDD82_3108 [Ophiocordyceps australis]
MATLIDPTLQAKYPVILGDGLLGKTSNEIFTGIRYNHKPQLSSENAPALARLKPSIPGKTTSYDLSFSDAGNSYAYSGTRNINGNTCVLYFDPKRKAFILDKVDSTFDMNITRPSASSDPEKPPKQHPFLKPRTLATKESILEKNSKAQAKNPPQSKPASRKADKPTSSRQEMKLSLPNPEPPKKPKSSKRIEEEDDEDDDDDDGGLLIEYPDGQPPVKKKPDFSPDFRRFDDAMDQRDSEGDADGESDGEPSLDFKLPSPVNIPPARPDQVQEEHHEQHDNDDSSADMEDDLAKEMEIAFEDLANSQKGSPGEGEVGDESEISEED